MKRNILVFVLLIFIYAACSNDDSEIDNPTDPETPNYTLGYVSTLMNFEGAKAYPPLSEKWEVVDVITDEFDGNALNSIKWNDLHPKWSGRAPSKFKRENTTVSDGYLKLKSTTRIDEMSEVTDPEKDIWVDAASMTSKAASAKVGYYYEASFKAADLSMTSSFWFRLGDYSEIDVIEHVGHASNGTDDTLAYNYSCNTHVYGPKVGPAPIGDTYKMPTRGRDGFNVYGFWWKDANTLLFYYNGEEVMKVTPAVPFEEDLYLIFDKEVFTWVGLPTISSLKDDSKNTMLIDFVRSYKITNNNLNTGKIKNGSFEINGSENWFWKGDVTLNTLTTNLNDGVFNVNLKNEGSIIQKINVVKNKDYTLNWNSKIDQGTVKVEIIGIVEKNISSSNWDAQNLNFNSGEKNEIYLRVTASSSSNVFLDAFRIE